MSRASLAQHATAKHGVAPSPEQAASTDEREPWGVNGVDDQAGVPWWRQCPFPCCVGMAFLTSRGTERHLIHEHPLTEERNAYIEVIRRHQRRDPNFLAAAEDRIEDAVIDEIKLAQKRANYRHYELQERERFGIRIVDAMRGNMVIWGDGTGRILRRR